MNVINMKLIHKEFGEGLLKSFLGDNIVVRFSHGDEILPVPESISCGDLKTANKEDSEKIDEMLERWKALKTENSVRDKEIEQNPRVAEVREYDKLMHKERQVDLAIEAEINAARDEYDKAINM